MNPMFNFLLALTAVLATATTNALSPVLDVEGDPLTAGNSYYVRPVNFVQGGGLTLLGHDEKPCPLDIALSPEADKGFPVKFSNWRPKIGFVPESESLNIETIAVTICIQPTYWWLSEGVVTTGPKPEGFSGHSLLSFFQIKKSYESGGSGYKFAFCFTEGLCMDVGVNGDKRLALSITDPLIVEFVKSGEGSSKTMSII